MTVFWLILLIAAIVAEVATVGLVSIWFAAGALAALVSALLGAWTWLQIVIFVVISAALLAATRPLVKKHLNSHRRPTNADRVLTMTGVVSEEIDNTHARGAVRVDGKEWTARSENGHVIPEGAIVRPVGIEGVKLIVKVESEGSHTEEKEE